GPVQSVKTMTWLSERSGIASIGVVRSAQYPHPASSANTAMTRTRFLSDTSINQLIIERTLPADGRGTATQGARAGGLRPSHSIRTTSYLGGKVQTGRWFDDEESGLRKRGRGQAPQRGTNQRDRDER